MNYQITSDNIEMSPSMHALVLEKFKKIESRLVDFSEDQKTVRVVMNSAKDDRFDVKIRFVLNGKEYFVEEESFTLENALITAIADLERELQTDKIIQIEENWKKTREAKRFDPVTAPQEISEDL
jgi:ribosome-associated translation inhibitor RaiA